LLERDICFSETEPTFGLHSSHQVVHLTIFLEAIWGTIEKMADPARQLVWVGDSGPMLRPDRVLGGDCTCELTTSCFSLI
jgi:hypothetical protein